ncbi:hypothetical protein [Clostridium sp.]|nr:hypothetical protein [Clostridium sp.]
MLKIIRGGGKLIIADLKQRQIPYILLSGNLEDRIDKVDRILSK